MLDCQARSLGNCLTKTKPELGFMQMDGQEVFNGHIVTDTDLPDICDNAEISCGGDRFYGNKRIAAYNQSYWSHAAIRGLHRLNTVSLFGLKILLYYLYAGIFHVAVQPFIFCQLVYFIQ